MELLKHLTECNSPSGREDSVRAVIAAQAQKYCDEIYTDTLGNLIARKGSGGKKIVLCAHMDEIGVVVTYRDDKGFLRFAPVGGLDKKNLVNRRVIFPDGVQGVIGIEHDAEKNEISKMYIDTGCAGNVQPGDMACFTGEFCESGSIVISKALDNRAGCYVLLEAMKRLENLSCEAYFVFTVQEEVGLRGAKTACFGIDADYAVAVDVTDTGDTPDCAPMSVSMGSGAAVKVMDRSVICHSEVRNRLISLAAENNIPYQLEIMTEGGTDAGAIHTTGTGVKTGGISIPTRYIHSNSEMADKNDIKAAADLLEKFIVSFS
ncbi:MAG: M42 family metallopeptidase [Clostridia bacterium]|nr:M42 family metallopeptidase [Clostridia bacterium]